MSLKKAEEFRYLLKFDMLSEVGPCERALQFTEQPGRDNEFRIAEFAGGEKRL
jgi:hypothetical protein